MSEPDFGELRSLLHEDPSSEAWFRLCRLIEPARWLDRRRWRDQILPYARAHLESWPASLREAPHRWVELILRGQGHEACSLSRSLTLHLQVLTGPEIRSLLTASWSEHLEEVTLRTVGLGPESGALLAALSPGLRRLRCLDVRRNDLGDDGLEALARTDGAPALRILSLAENDIGSRGAAALARAPWLLRLDRLNLHGNHIGDEGARALADSSFVEGVELELGGNAVGVAGAQALARSAYLPEAVRRAWRAEMLRQD